MVYHNELKIIEDCKKIQVELENALRAGKRIDHKEIYSKLGIPPTTYWKRVARIYEVERGVFEEISKSSVASRTLRIREALEFVSTTNYEIANDKGAAPKDRRECSQAYFTAELWLYQLDSHGPNLPELQDYVKGDVDLRVGEVK